MRSVLFKSHADKERIDEWSERFRARISRQTESRRVPTRFGETHVLVAGPESAPPLVLLHGALASAAHVLGEVQPLLEHFRVYAIDIIGQSVKSADTRLSVKNNDYGEWLVEVMNTLGLSRVHLVGVSWGGFVAQRLAAVAPQRIERLVLIVPAGMVSGSAWEGFTRMGLPMWRYLRSPSPQRLDDFVRNLLSTTDDDWKPYIGDAFRSYNMNMSVPRLSKAEEFSALKAPVLVIAAGRDLSFPGRKLLSRASTLFATLQDTELLEDSCHSPPTTEEFRAWMGERLRRFLQPQ